MNRRRRSSRDPSRHDADSPAGNVLSTRLLAERGRQEPTREPDPPERYGPADLIRLFIEDIRTIVERDPSIRTVAEALLHPALPALCVHRVAHLLHKRGSRLTARALMAGARALTGTEIHPGATLGRRVFIDHGAAVVIGETAVVGDDVTIYHQVTLGAVGWRRDNRRLPGERRHPVVGSGCVLGAGATVLGPVNIGHRAVIGAQAVVLTDIPDDTHVLPEKALRTSHDALPKIAWMP
ncbi:serine O-acetyltransferase [Streptomyces puniciscabiei]|uniref:serine O-acetyltransferase n=1 Tax=Streptomyces puniciscabiei TaxID=164348 RepID=A0A542SXC4_9ACTN|nr:serine O-acetyltransferase [Streptomyces puniciscabiei]